MWQAAGVETLCRWKSHWHDTLTTGVGRNATQSPDPLTLTGVQEGRVCVTVPFMDFNELIALMRDPGEDGLPETIYDDLTSSYNLAVEGGAARASELEAANGELMAEIARLKALNFDLLMAASGDSADESADESPTEPPGDVSIDSLFE